MFVIFVPRPALGIFRRGQNESALRQQSYNNNNNQQAAAASKKGRVTTIGRACDTTKKKKESAREREKAVRDTQCECESKRVQIRKIKKAA